MGKVHLIWEYVGSRMLKVMIGASYWLRAVEVGATLRLNKMFHIENRNRKYL